MTTESTRVLSGPNQPHFGQLFANNSPQLTIENFWNKPSYPKIKTALWYVLYIHAKSHLKTTDDFKNNPPQKGPFEGGGFYFLDFFTHFLFRGYQTFFGWDFRWLGHFCKIFLTICLFPTKIRVGSKKKPSKKCQILEKIGSSSIRIIAYFSIQKSWKRQNFKWSKIIDKMDVGHLQGLKKLNKIILNHFWAILDQPLI